MRFITLMITALIFGIGICAYRRGWIIIAYPTTHYSPKKSMCKKEVNVYWYHDEKWHQESVTLLWSDTMATNIYHITNRWLQALDDEHIIETPVTVQSACITPSGSTVYLSFDSSPLPSQASAYAKVCIIEGLLKTIRHNAPSIQEIYLLLHHQPLVDAHLDCSHAWPIAGFIT